MMPYALSLGVGVAVGVLYGLLGVRSPAPPIIALLGLLGMLAGEMAVNWFRGHPEVISTLCHAKSFAIAKKVPDDTPSAPGGGSRNA
jgi:XapX domain-containing protein